MKTKSQIEKALEHKNKMLLEDEVKNNNVVRRIILNQIKLLKWILDK